MSDTDNLWTDAEVISTYTRAQALADGFLIDVSDTAREAGFKWPVAVTNAVWAECCEWTPADTERQTPQDTAGRLWDVLFMAHYGISQSRQNDDASTLLFQLYVVPRDGRCTAPQLTQLKLHSGPGDNAEPVLTIMLPTED